jgi:hypothetical protein
MTAIFVLEYISLVLTARRRGIHFSVSGYFLINALKSSLIFLEPISELRIFKLNLDTIDIVMDFFKIYVVAIVCDAVTKARQPVLKFLLAI